MKRDIQHLKFLVPIIGIFLMAFSGFAADVRMTIEPKRISLLDRAILKVEYTNTDGTAIDIPEVEGLNIQYQGPSRRMEMINFKTTTSVTHSYLVTPSKTGNFTIGPVTVQFKGGEKKLSANLEVVKPEDDKKAQEVAEIMFSEITADREAPHVNEPFGLTLKVYIKDGVQTVGGFNIVGGTPDQGLDGEIEWEVINRGREQKNGQIFNVYTVKARVKTLTAGTFTFQPQVQLNVVIPRQNRRSYQGDPFFGDLFGRQETRRFILDCNKLDVEVKPVPMIGRPDSFTGGVGLFDFNVEVGPKEVKAGEPITVKMRIRGRGNLTQITPPKIPESLDYKLYEVRSVPAESANEVRFEQVLIPKSDAVTEVPEIEFSYFNTTTTDFRTITKGPFPVTVEPAPQQTAQVIATTPHLAQQETQVLGRDIIYLKSRPKHWKRTSDQLWFNTTAFRILSALPLAILLLGGLIRARRSRLNGNVARARRQQAPGAARKQIQRAEQALRKSNGPVFYEALWNALTDYFGHRLNLPPGEISAQRVSTAFDQQRQSVESVFSAIEQRRYGVQPEESSKEEMKQLLRDLTALLKQCERVKL
ncbi:BatD family protein [Pontiella agarivorans]|uniref:BatD family protein n=1 Tax=Pontiella agarivorans TaxID=3038953 RepID=A0ABU5MYF6_9BACT|nr:BatD family protein [Pontiella agarivorans]MDZ8119244.1 BatD family protein [Pontiella agarivorans]